MKKFLLLVLLWCTCIALWIIFWFSDRRSLKTVVLEYSADSTTLRDSVSEVSEHSQIDMSAYQSQSDCINLNTSGAERLCELPGVGPGLAQKIVAFRKQNGTFKNAEDLLKIKGIGSAKLERLRKQVCF